MKLFLRAAAVANPRRKKIQGKFRLSNMKASREGRKGEALPSPTSRPSRETGLPVLLLGFAPDFVF
jgi:hypothetical protein